MKLTFETPEGKVEKEVIISSVRDFKILDRLLSEPNIVNLEVQVYDIDFTPSDKRRDIYTLVVPPILRSKASKITYINSEGKSIVLKDKYMGMSEEEKEKHLSTTISYVKNFHRNFKEIQLSSTSPKVSIKELKTAEDFENLVEGDYLAVTFKKPVTWDGEKDYTFKVFSIYKIWKSDKEIVLQKKNNVYFLWENFLKGESHVESVSLITHHSV